MNDSRLFNKSLWTCGPINLINVHTCMQPRSSQDGLGPPWTRVHAPNEWPTCMQDITIIIAGHLKMMEIIGIFFCLND